MKQPPALSSLRDHWARLTLAQRDRGGLAAASARLLKGRSIAGNTMPSNADMDMRENLTDVDSAIPRTIHRIWVGDPEPEWQKACGRTWHKPGWEVHQYDRPPFGLQNQPLYDRAEELAPGCEGQFRSDILRLELLYVYGGVYVDCDFALVTSIDDLLDVPVFLAWEVQGKWANNAIVGATRRHPFIGRLIDYLPDSVRRNQGKKPNLMTGPQYVTHMLRRWGRNVTVYDQAMFYPLSWRDHQQAHYTPTAEVRAVHWFANKRSERGGVEPVIR